ncbi:AraC family transcriptional regulator [Shinella sp. CPCC 101442]|uniref:AraC family transcriptional regulator n=1 Tax=Shinella sp. CPCC 101442 TaxID=2932265 RepID=UPI0021529793|nr:AraC family transcriptional regulator [Shinella sp. CPCC 101442]MCR6500715.1 AraC family transcriptional regulator [Shinella sp. CPCC 101442]
MSIGHFQIFRTDIDGVEAVVADSSHTFARHSHDTYGIGMIERGAQTSASGRGRVMAEAGNTITVNPGEVHDGVPIGDTPRAWRMLYLRPEIVAAAADDIFEGPPREEFHAPVLEDRRVAALASAALAALLDGIAAPLAHEERLLLLLAAVLHERPPRRAGIATSSIGRARDRLDSAPATAITLEELAEESGIGRFRLVRDFARMTGLTPHAYLLQRRTELARRLIATGTPLAAAASEAGFADQSHMTRNFTRRYGYTPGAWLAART